MILSIILSSVLIGSCNGQDIPKMDWEKYLQPLNDQLAEQIHLNDSLFNNLVLVEKNPLHDKVLIFRNTRIAQHQLIDSLKKMIHTKNDADYYEVFNESRKLLLRDGNLEKLQNGENNMVTAIQLIHELKDNSAMTKSLRTFRDVKRDNLDDNSMSYYHGYGSQIYSSQFIYLNFENVLLELIPTFDKRRKGSGHPEYDSIQYSKYNCIYKSYDNYITIGDPKDKVVDILGQPKSVMNYYKQDSSNYYLYYKRDYIVMHRDTVIGWDNRENTLKVKLESSADVNSIEHMTIGSSKCEVLALLGTPHELDIKVVDPFRKLYNCHEKWGYGDGSDYLCFSYKDELMEYDNRGNSFDIRLKSSKMNSDYFSIGSTKEEVAALNGSPTKLTTSKAEQKERWVFLKGSRHGLIEFKNGKVISVDNSGKLLKFKY